MNKIKLDLDNPIFTFYVDVSNMPRARSEEMLHQIKDNFDIYENVTIWVVASDQNRVECSYSGNRNESNIGNLIKDINERIDILSNSNNFDDFKINIGDWRINTLIKE